MFVASTRKEWHFVVCAWPLTLGNPCANMDPGLFFQKCGQRYWDGPGEVEAPWVLVGAASSERVGGAYRAAWAFIWPLMYCALALRKCLENYIKKNTEHLFLTDSLKVVWKCSEKHAASNETCRYCVWNITLFHPCLCHMWQVFLDCITFFKCYLSF